MNFHEYLTWKNMTIADAARELEESSQHLGKVTRDSTCSDELADKIYLWSVGKIRKNSLTKNRKIPFFRPIRRI